MLDTELWEISDVLKIALKENISTKARRNTVSSDSQAAIKQLQGSKRNAGQALKTQIHNGARQLQAHNGEITVKGITSHS